MGCQIAFRGKYQKLVPANKEIASIASEINNLLEFFLSELAYFSEEAESISFFYDEVQKCLISGEQYMLKCHQSWEEITTTCAEVIERSDFLPEYANEYEIMLNIAKNCSQIQKKFAEVMGRKCSTLEINIKTQIEKSYFSDLVSFFRLYREKLQLMINKLEVIEDWEKIYANPSSVSSVRLIMSEIETILEEKVVSFN